MIIKGICCPLCLVTCTADNQRRLLFATCFFNGILLFPTLVPGKHFLLYLPMHKESDKQSKTSRTTTGKRIMAACELIFQISDFHLKKLKDVSQCGIKIALQSFISPCNQNCIAIIYFKSSVNLSTCVQICQCHGS